MEELYDHDIDENEWENIAYKPDNKKLIIQQRGLLQQQVPDLTWKTSVPLGYKLLENGSIQKLDFVPIENLKLLKWWL